MNPPSWSMWPQPRRGPAASTSRRSRPRPTKTRAACFLSALLLFTAASGCGDSSTPAPDQAGSSGARASGSAGDEPDTPPKPARPKITSVTAPDGTVQIFDPRDLAAELGPGAPAGGPSQLTSVNIALADEDRLGAPAGSALDDIPPLDCTTVELPPLDPMPALTSLRVSGCALPARAVLAQTGPALRELELSDLTIDMGMLAQLAALESLSSLTLVRVRVSGIETIPSRRLARLERLTLRELQTDSPLSQLLGDAPNLRDVRLVGAWAGHKAMLSMGKADRLERLALIDTRVGNFSLHQIKGLDRLSTIEWRGVTFNNNSPLYLRTLPVETFTCACPGFSDGGLAHLRHVTGLRRLSLPKSSITGAGLTAMGVLPALGEVTIRAADVGKEGLAALAKQPALTSLELATETLTDPTMKHLGELVGLRRLVLEIPLFDDRGAPQLAPLTKLEYLDLGNTAISDRGLSHIATLTALQTLKLHHTRVTNRGLEPIGGLARLETLELDHTDVVDGGVAHLAGLGTLRHLRLDHTLITDASLEHIATLESLEHLNLAHTVVTTEGLRALGKLPNLTAVNVEGTRARRSAGPR